MHFDTPVSIFHLIIYKAKLKPLFKVLLQWILMTVTPSYGCNIYSSIHTTNVLTEKNPRLK